MNSENNTHPDNEVLVRVEGVSKKFCRSLKKSLWYGVCDIAGELSPFGRRDIAGDWGQAAPAGDSKIGYGRWKMGDRGQAEPAGGSESAQSSISHIPSSSPPLRDGEFWAVNDVSFELRRGEPGGEVAARRIGVANPEGEMSGKRTNQCLGLIGRNGAGIQAVPAARKTAAGSPKGETSYASESTRRF